MRLLAALEKRMCSGTIFKLLLFGLNLKIENKVLLKRVLVMEPDIIFIKNRSPQIIPTKSFYNLRQQKLYIKIRTPFS